MDKIVNTEERKHQPRTIEMQLEDIAERKRKLTEKEKRLKAKLSTQERNKRTKRLIEIGAVTEKVIGTQIEKEDLPKLIAFLGQYGKFYSNAAITVK